MNRIVSLALLMLIVLSQAACGDSADGDVTTSSDTSSEVSDGTTAPEYEFADLDWGGDTFTVLNASTTWGFYQYMDFEEQTGESSTTPSMSATAMSRRCITSSSR